MKKIGITEETIHYIISELYKEIVKNDKIPKPDIDKIKLDYAQLSDLVLSRIPKPEDGKDYVLTDKDKKLIRDEIEESLPDPEKIKGEIVTELEKKSPKFDSDFVENIISRVQSKLPQQKLDSSEIVKGLLDNITTTEEQKKIDFYRDEVFSPEIKTALSKQVLDQIEIPKDGDKGEPGEKGDPGKDAPPIELSERDKKEIAEFVDVTRLIKDRKQDLVELVKKLKNGQIKIKSSAGIDVKEIVNEITNLLGSTEWQSDDQSAADVPIEDTGGYYSSDNVEEALADIGETRTISGYDKTDPTSQPDLAFDNSTRSFSCSVKSGQTSFHFWVDDMKVVKEETQSVIIPDVTGTYYIIFDTDGELTYTTEDSVAQDDFYEHAITGLVYWNATTQGSIAGDETHGILMDPRTHHYNHSTFGARYESGLGIVGLANGSNVYTNTSAGFFWDEDIRHSVVSQSTHPFIYKLGSSGEWNATAPDNRVGYDTGGVTDNVFNELTGGVWQLTESGSVQDSDYVIYFFIVTPDISGFPVKKIIGQNAYKNKKAARAAIESEINNIVTDGLPSPEFIFLYAYIVKKDGNLEDLDNGDLYVDLRVLKGGASSAGGGVTAWTGLTDTPATFTGEGIPRVNTGGTALDFTTLLKSGSTQANAGAVSGEFWRTASHATLPDNVILQGV